jgi:hypothetical protein
MKRFVSRECVLRAYSKQGKKEGRGSLSCVGEPLPVFNERPKREGVSVQVQVCTMTNKKAHRF